MRHLRLAAVGGRGIPSPSVGHREPRPRRRSYLESHSPGWGTGRTLTREGQGQVFLGALSTAHAWLGPLEGGEATRAEVWGHRECFAAVEESEDVPDTRKTLQLSWELMSQEKELCGVGYAQGSWGEFARRTPPRRHLRPKRSLPAPAEQLWYSR